MAIYYSTEARMYALLLCLVLLAVYGLLTERPMVWGLAIGAGLLTHYLFVLYLPGMVLLGRRTVRSWSALLTGSGLVALLFAPWLPVVASQSTDVYGAYWLTYAGPGRSLLDVVQLLSGQWLSAGPLLVVSLVVLGCLFLGSGVAIRARYWEILALAWGPALLGWLISWLAMPILMPRVLIGSLPFLLLLVAWGYQRIEALAGRWAWSLAVVPLVCWLSVYRPIRPDYAVLYAALAIAPGQTCAHLTPGSLLLARHYTPQCRHVLWSNWQRKPNGLSPATVSALELPQGDINEADWLFYTTEPFSTPGELAYLAGVHGAASSLAGGGFYHHQVWRLEK